MHVGFPGLGAMGAPMPRTWPGAAASRQQAGVEIHG
jgi:3-hydroxyisobutyrate dehydrogenase-like beta-hydroxyacid dehydrogenase